MTQSHTTPINVRRHPNGVIDLDYYRERATALRGAAHRDAAALKFLLAGMSLSSCLLVGFLVLAVTRPTTIVEHIPAPARTSVVR